MDKNTYKSKWRIEIKKKKSDNSCFGKCYNRIWSRYILDCITAIGYILKEIFDTFNFSTECGSVTRSPSRVSLRSLVLFGWDTCWSNDLISIHIGYDVYVNLFRPMDFMSHEKMSVTEENRKTKKKMSK
jgi:hypothetical protein